MNAQDPRLSPLHSVDDAVSDLIVDQDLLAGIDAAMRRLLADATLESLQDALSIDRENAPLTRVADSAVLRLSEASAAWVEGEFPEQDGWEVTTDVPIVYAARLLDRPNNPTVAWAAPADFEIPARGRLRIRHANPWNVLPLETTVIRAATVIPVWDASAAAGGLLSIRVGSGETEWFNILCQTGMGLASSEHAAALLGLPREGSHHTPVEIRAFRRAHGSAVPGVPQRDGTRLVQVGSWTWLARGAWTAGISYAENDVVAHEHKLVRCLSAHTAGSSFEPSRWQACETLIDTDVDVRVALVLATRVETDDGLFWQQHGQPFDAEPPQVADEAYRAEINERASLSIHGSTLERLRRAVSAAARIPTPLATERVLGFRHADDVENGTGLTLRGTAWGRGTYRTTGTFTPDGEAFLDHQDAGAVLTIHGENTRTRTVLSVAPDGTMTLDGAPPSADERRLRWSLRHPSGFGTASLTGEQPRGFIPDDVGHTILPRGTNHEGNRTPLRILSVLNPREALVSGDVRDESGMLWSLRGREQHTIVTNLRVLHMPADVNPSESARNPGITLSASDTFTADVSLEDLETSPHWWRGRALPGAFEVPDRRLIRHTMRPSDGARFDDPGMHVGVDDERQVTERTHEARWIARNTLKVEGQILETDLRQSVVVRDANGRTVLQILELNVAAGTITVRTPRGDRTGLRASVTLPPEILRRSAQDVASTRLVAKSAALLTLTAAAAKDTRRVLQVLREGRCAHVLIHVNTEAAADEPITLQDDVTASAQITAEERTEVPDAERHFNTHARFDEWICLRTLEGSGTVTADQLVAGGFHLPLSAALQAVVEDSLGSPVPAHARARILRAEVSLDDVPLRVSATGDEWLHTGDLKGHTDVDPEGLAWTMRVILAVGFSPAAAGVPMVWPDDARSGISGGPETRWTLAPVTVHGNDALSTQPAEDRSLLDDLEVQWEPLAPD